MRPGRRQSGSRTSRLALDVLGLVVAGQTVDSGLDQNQTEFTVLVLAVSLEMLSHGDGLLDKEVKVLWDLWLHALRLQHSEDLVSGDVLGLRDTVLVSDLHTDGRWSVALLAELDNRVNDVVLAHSEPVWRLSDVRESAGAHTLAWCVHSSHDGWFGGFLDQKISVSST